MLSRGTGNPYTGPLPSPSLTARLGTHRPHRNVSVEGSRIPVGTLPAPPTSGAGATGGSHGLALFICQSVHCGHFLPVQPGAPTLAIRPHGTAHRVRTLVEFGEVFRYAVCDGTDENPSAPSSA